MRRSRLASGSASNDKARRSIVMFGQWAPPLSTTLRVRPEVAPAANLEPKLRGWHYCCGCLYLPAVACGEMTQLEKVCTYQERLHEFPAGAVKDWLCAVIGTLRQGYRAGVSCPS